MKKSISRFSVLVLLTCLLLVLLPSCWAWVIMKNNNPKYKGHWHLSKKRAIKEDFKIYRKGLFLGDSITVRTDGIYLNINEENYPKHFVFKRFFKSGHYIACIYNCKEDCPKLDTLREKYVSMFNYGYYTLSKDGKVIIERHDNVVGTQKTLNAFQIKSGYLQLLGKVKGEKYDVSKDYSNDLLYRDRFLPILFKPGYQPNW